MDRFFCVLALCALLTCAWMGGCVMHNNKVQPAFFSLLFPQLMPQFDLDEADSLLPWGEAVFL